jgi:predicted ATP-binding protein involved in virulence
MQKDFTPKYRVTYEKHIIIFENGGQKSTILKFLEILLSLIVKRDNCAIFNVSGSIRSCQEFRSVTQWILYTTPINIGPGFGPNFNIK